jgi:DNA-binding helix-hairpin-helix protein with protein kinase domain
LEKTYRDEVSNANAERNKILSAIRSEKARRDAAYKAAVRKADSEWNEKVRSANAAREAILTDMRRELDIRRQSLHAARHNLERAELERHRAASEYQGLFDRLRRDLGVLKSEYLDLKPKYEEEYRHLERNKEAAQLVQFLQTQFISDHDIPGIGPTREAVLRSNGIETANDIKEDSILEIGGFGPVLTGALLTWKEEVTRRFRFNRAAGVSQNELATLVVNYRQLQQRIEAKMQTALADLRACSDKAGRHLSQLYDRIPGLVVRFEQARIDLQVVSEWELLGI